MQYLPTQLHPGHWKCMFVWGGGWHFHLLQWIGEGALSWHPTNRGWGCYELNHAAHTMICPSQHTSYSSITGPLSPTSSLYTAAWEVFSKHKSDDASPVFNHVPSPKDKQKSKPKVWSTRCCLPLQFQFRSAFSLPHIHVLQTSHLSSK